ncbi:MAG: RidA family protein [Chloroflexota bacterium]
MTAVEKRLEELGLDLPIRTGPLANYVSTVRTGNLVFVSGHGPTLEGKPMYVGKLGADMDLETGYAAAKLTMLNCLASLKIELGDLDRVKRVVKLLGMVNATPDYTDHPRVINGASDLLVEIFGEKGRHARSAVGMASLPFGIPVEIEMIVEVE